MILNFSYICVSGRCIRTGYFIDGLINVIVSRGFNRLILLKLILLFIPELSCHWNPINFESLLLHVLQRPVTQWVSMYYLDLLSTGFSFQRNINTHLSWWRHQMETFSALLAICARNSLVAGEFPAQRPVTRSFDLRLNKRLSKQSWGWWFETLSRPLWRHCNVFYAIPQSSCNKGEKNIDINSLASGRCGCSDLKSIIIKIIIHINSLVTHCEIAFRRIAQNLIDTKSTLVQVMAWRRQATSHYLSQCWPRSMSPYDITRLIWYLPIIASDDLATQRAMASAVIDLVLSE